MLKPVFFLVLWGVSLCSKQKKPFAQNEISLPWVVHAKIWSCASIVCPWDLTMNMNSRQRTLGSILNPKHNLNEDYMYKKYQESDKKVLFMTCSEHVHDMFMTCSWHVHDMFMACSWHVHDMFITCSQNVHDMCTTCLFHIQDMFTTCSPHVYNMFITCSQHVYDMFTTWCDHVMNMR